MTTVYLNLELMEKFQEYHKNWLTILLQIMHLKNYLKIL